MFVEDFKVRFCETDALGHVNNTVMPAWFEAAREPVFKLFNPELNLQEWNLILASYKVDFMAPVFLGPTVTIKTMISRVGGASFDVLQQAWQKDKLVAEGTTTLVSYDYNTESSVKISEEIKQQLLLHPVE